MEQSTDKESLLEFNEHQRNVFCVFSGAGIGRLREYLNKTPALGEFDDNWTMYDGNGGFNEGTEFSETMSAENTAQQQVNGVTGLMGATAIEETDEDIGDDSEVIS